MTTLQPLSPIQNRILSELKRAKSLRYSELLQEKVPNDLFNYHLQFLVRKELVTKADEGYALSPKGLKHIADPLPAAGPFQSLFKLNVITVVSRPVKDKFEILNQVRASNPSFGKVGVMGGVVRKGERIEEAATRKLKEETGLEAEFRLLGCERRMLYKKGELFSDVMFPVCYADESVGTLLPKTEFGENIWVPIDTALANESGTFDSLRTIALVLQAVKNRKLHRLPLFFEETVQSDELSA
ncbi:MAG: NUDIX hydrolase [bacterium]|nr:NUDIX hydrolase [bacterium]